MNLLNQIDRLAVLGDRKLQGQQAVLRRYARLVREAAT